MRIAVFALIVLTAVACGGDEGSRQSPSQTACATFCTNVSTQQCSAPALGAPDCVTGCVQFQSTFVTSCVQAFADYLGCVNGAVSLQCVANTVTVTISAPSCDLQVQAVLHCLDAGYPGCIAQPARSADCTNAKLPAHPLQCSARPAGCELFEGSAAPGATGLYCCP
jgi:hypothetical protein